MMGRYGQGQGDKGTPSSPGFQGIFTGVVSQRKLFYQAKMGDEKGAEPHNRLLRSTTWVKGEGEELEGFGKTHVPKSQSTHLIGNGNSAEVEPTGNSQKTAEDESEAEMKQVQPVQSTTTTTDTVGDGPGTELHEHERTLTEDDSQHQNQKTETDSTSITSKTSTSSSFRIRHDGSGTSTNSLHRSGRSVSREREHNAISDSEFLIDDEISDQPQLTLTFKGKGKEPTGKVVAILYMSKYRRYYTY
jgi:hypothetical protein